MYMYVDKRICSESYAYAVSSLLANTCTVSPLISLSSNTQPPTPQALKFMCEIKKRRASDRKRESERERTHGAATQEVGEKKKEEKGGREERGREIVTC